jgi:hypothetical protein
MDTVAEAGHAKGSPGKEEDHSRRRHGRRDQAAPRLEAGWRGDREQPMHTWTLPEPPGTAVRGWAGPGTGTRSASRRASFGRQLAALPDQTRRLVRLAAADPSGDATLVWRAAGRLGIGVDAAGPAAKAGVAEFGARVRFRHPLVRSAAYRSAPAPERQQAHGALAEVTDPGVDPERRARAADAGGGAGQRPVEVVLHAFALLLTEGHKAAAVLYNALGRYDAARATPCLRCGSSKQRRLGSLGYSRCPNRLRQRPGPARRRWSQLARTQPRATGAVATGYVTCV